MSEASLVQIALALLASLAGVMWFLLRSKDAKQETAITTLFVKHDEDVRRLQDLEVKVAANHPDRGELERRFDKLETAFSTGFQTLNSKFDKLTETAMTASTAAVAAAQAATTTAQAATAVAQAAERSRQH